MKAAVDHRVPLPTSAIAILEQLAEHTTSDFVFQGRRSGRPASATAMVVLAHDLGIGATIHDSRSAFRDWCGEETSFPREVCEQALAHATGSAVEAAYRRGDALEKRRALMERQYCEPTKDAKVITLTRATK